jgi:hypothetical protein
MKYTVRYIKRNPKTQYTAAMLLDLIALKELKDVQTKLGVVVLEKTGWRTPSWWEAITYHLGYKTP